MILKKEICIKRHGKCTKMEDFIKNIRQETFKKYEEITEEYEKYKEYISLSSICKKYKADFNFLSKYLEFKGIHALTIHERNLVKLEKISKEYINGKSIEYLHKKYHTSREYISKYLRSKNIPIRNSRIYFYDENYFDIIDTEWKAYWLGFIVADGNVYRCQLTLGLSIKDKKHLEKFAKIFDVLVKEKRQINKYHAKNKKYKKYIRVVFAHLNSIKIVNSIIEKGVPPKKSLILTDKVFNFIPENLLNHFIRGYFDGDGCISFNKNTKHYNVSFLGTKKFLNHINSIFEKELGINISSISKRKKIHCLQYSGSFKIIKIRDWVYKNATVFLERKKELFDKIEIGKNYKDKISIYRGVTWSKNNKKWVAQIQIGYDRVFSGYFKTEIEAAKAYNREAIKHNLPKYKLNIIED